MTVFRNLCLRRQIQLAPHRYVVGRVGQAAYGLVDAGGGEPVGGLRREQEMVDTQAPVLGPAAGLVVPEGVDRRVGLEGADRVGQAEVDQAAQRPARLRLAERVVGEGFRVIDVHLGRAD